MPDVHDIGRPNNLALASAGKGVVVGELLLGELGRAFALFVVRAKDRRAGERDTGLQEFRQSEGSIGVARDKVAAVRNARPIDVQMRVGEGEPDRALGSQVIKRPQVNASPPGAQAGIFHP